MVTLGRAAVWRHGYNRDACQHAADDGDDGLQSGGRVNGDGRRSGDLSGDGSGRFDEVRA